jgi:hypothetical protein
MNKILVSLSASLAVFGLAFAQVPGGIQEAPRPGQTPFPLGQGVGMRAGGGAASVAASGNFVYVLSGNTLYQFSVDGLKLVTKTTLPANDRREGGRRNDPLSN